MLRYLSCLSLSLCLTVPIISLQATARELEIDRPGKFCTANLAQNIERILNRPNLKRSHWGISIRTLDGDREIYSLDEDKYFTPASVAKLLTSAAALLELNGDFRIYTPIYGTGKPPHLTSLRVKGQGDPTISTQSLENIVHQLRERGIKKY